MTDLQANSTACAAFPTGIELAEDRTPEDESNKIPHLCFLSLVTLTFDLDIRTRVRFLYNSVHLTANLHHPTFNRSEVIVLRN